MLKLLRLLSRTSRWGAVSAALAGVLSGVTGAGLIAVVNEAIDPGSRFSRPTLLVAFLALFAAVPLSRLLSDFLLVRLGQKAVYHMRVLLSERILAAPLRRLETLGNHRLLATLTDDILAITVSIAELPTLFVNLTLIVACTAYIGWISLVLLAVFAGSLTLGVVTYRLAMTGGVTGFRRAREKYDELYGHFRSLTEGSKELKLHVRRRLAFLAAVDETAKGLMGLFVKARMIFSMAGNWASSLFFVAIGLAVFGRPYLPSVLTGKVVGFVLVLLYVRGPLQALMNSLPQLTRGGVALDKVEMLGLDLLEAPEPTTGLPEPDPGWRLLELRGVRRTYRHDAGERGFTLGPLDFELRPGEIVFLVGGNGSGKTTFAKLLTGLYVPEKGEVRLDGRAIGEEERETYRQQFSAVFSEFHLFDRLLGLDGADVDLRAQRLLEELDLEHKVTIRGGDLSTTQLSRGQRKRLALLTAYLEDRPIYLFDEWAADQDPEFKEVFYRRLLPELKARAKGVVVISHDDRYFGVGDRVIRLDEGKLADLGGPTDAAAPADARLYSA